MADLYKDDSLRLVVAKRSNAYLKMGIAGPSGSGKTFGSLLFAFGMMKEKYPTLPDDELWQKIVIIDTENGSGQLYVGSQVDGLKIGSYNAITVNAPFAVSKYIRAIDLAVESGMEVAIIDSLTHAWSAEGGLLEVQANIAKRTGNSWTAWRDITPLHNKLVNIMLQSSIHIIATVRSKQEYMSEERDGRKSIVKKGMEPEQRKGMEYEFTTFLDVEADHTAFSTKDRTSIYDQRAFIINPDEGRKAMRWLMTADEKPHTVLASSDNAEELSEEDEVKALQKEVIEMVNTRGGTKNKELMDLLVASAPPHGNPNTLKDVDALNALIQNIKLIN